MAVPPAVTGADESQPPYHTDKPVREAVVFRVGQLCTGDYEAFPAFSPDGHSLFFVKSTPDGRFRTIVESRYDVDWAIPRTSSFSGQYDDFAPFVTADGNRVYFASRRPAAGTGSMQSHADLWVVERTGEGWGEARALEAPINGPSNETSVCVGPDGTLYFSSDRAGGLGGLDLYRASFSNGQSRKVEHLGKVVNTSGDERDPRFTDSGMLLFSSSGRTDGTGGLDLYVARRAGGGWGPPENLGGRVNSVSDDFAPCLAPGGKYFFWTSTRGFADDTAERAWQYPELLARLRSAGNGSGDLYWLEWSAVGIER
jgi:Tol biopolymer transport system component